MDRDRRASATGAVSANDAMPRRDIRLSCQELLRGAGRGRQVLLRLLYADVTRRKTRCTRPRVVHAHRRLRAVRIGRPRVDCVIKREAGPSRGVSVRRTAPLDWWVAGAGSAGPGLGPAATYGRRWVAARHRCTSPLHSDAVAAQSAGRRHGGQGQGDGERDSVRLRQWKRKGISGESGQRRARQGECATARTPPSRYGHPG